MPIAVRVVSEAEFADWLAKTKPSAARDDAEDDAKKVAAAKD
jgi:heme/copper-type cytochrome/quinol oxidase subunit 2